MAYFSARARKLAWDTPSPSVNNSNSFDDEDGASSFITGGISRRSTGDTNISSDNAVPKHTSRSSISSSSLRLSPEPMDSSKAYAASMAKPFHETLEEKRKTKHLLERRVVSFPLPEEGDQETTSSGKQHQQQQDDDIKRISRADSIARFIAALDQHGQVIVEGSTREDADMKFEAID